MNILLSNIHEKQDLTRSTIIKYIFCFFILFYPLGSFAQKQYDNIKKILYLSYLIDDISLNSHPLELMFNSLVIYADSSFNDFYYESSEQLELHFFNDDSNNSDKYTIQLFKIPREFHPYYVLYFNSSTSFFFSFWDNLWIRASGYAENDLKLFFDGLQEMGMSLDRIKAMINIWRENDSLFNELDWDCLIEGYETNDTQKECFVSHIYSTHDRACVNCTHAVSNHNVYSTFSRILLKGFTDPRQ